MNDNWSTPTTAPSRSATTPALPEARPISLHPSKLFQGNAVIPDLGHVANPIAVELHHIHVVGFHLFARRRDRTTVSCMSTAEHSERGYVVPLLIHSKRSKIVAPVWDWSEQTLRPLGVRLQGLYALERTRLCGEGGVSMAESLARFPASAGLTRIEELRSDLFHRTHSRAFQSVDS